jgi:hypothetical protein
LEQKEAKAVAFLQSSCPYLPSLSGASDRERAIVATLLYYDLFGFPLRASELVRFAHITGAGSGFSQQALAPESAWWSSADGFWFLGGRDALVARRQQMARCSGSKLDAARRWALWLQWIPGMRFVGVTGSLSMESASPEDDIDLLVITAPGRLWSTRAQVLACLSALRVKRPDDGRSEHPNKACVNVLLSEDDLALPDRNLFIAHEICQMLPLLGQDTYRRFLDANLWVREFLPQWQPVVSRWEDRQALQTVRRAAEAALPGRARSLLERWTGQRQLASIQHKHARGHNHNVKLTTTQLRFHPDDVSQEVMRTFETTWQTLNQ